MPEGLTYLTKDAYRERFDEPDIRYLTGDKYPKKLPASAGSSMVYQISEREYFKRKPGDGIHGMEPMGIFTQHSFVNNEFYGSFDDLGEVMAYTLAKNMGTRAKTMYDGTKKQVPLVDNAEYKLAIYYTTEGVGYRGCSSTSIVPEGSPRNQIIKGRQILNNVYGSVGREFNSLPHYLSAFEKYAEQQSVATKRNVVVDPNMGNDLIINSYFCWKIGNIDNHNGNMVFVQEEMPDGSLLLGCSKLIDNGAAWQLNTTQKKDGEKYSVTEKTFFTAGGVLAENENGNPMVVFTKDPYKHTAFYLYAGNLNGHNKQIGDEKFEYEFDLAANMLSNPEVYDAIYQIEQQFDIDRAINELSKEYWLNYPNLVPETMRGLTDFKSNLLASVVADYYCYSTFTSCIGPVDQQNPSGLYLTFKEQMGALPLQPNMESYMNEFLNIATENQVAVDPEMLASVNFMPKPEQTQNADPTEGSAQ